MSNKISSTVFATGAKDSLATKDVYSASGKAIINSIQALQRSTGVDITSLLGGKATTALGSVLSLVSSGLQINKDTLTARLIGTNSNISSAFKSLTSGVTDSMLGSLSEQKTFIESNINGITSMVDSTKFDSLSSVGSFINDYTGNDLFSVNDKDAVSSLLGGIVSEGCNLGMTNVFSSLTSTIEDQTIVSKIVDNSIQSALTNYDLDTLVDISSSSAGKYIEDKYPDFANTFISSYSNSDFNEEGINTDVDKYTKLITVLTNINSDWASITRQGGSDVAINLVKLMGGSNDFAELISIGIKSIADDNSTQKYYGLQNAYAATTVEDDIHRYFPKVVLDKEYNGTKKSTTRTSAFNNVDPRLIGESAAIVGVLLTS